MIKNTIFIPVVALILALAMSCSDEPANTDRVVGTVGHETLHCFFGQWHAATGKLPRRIEATSQKYTSVNVTLVFAPEEALQDMYRAATTTFIDGDRDVVKVDGFNVLDPNNNSCIVYVLEG